MDKGETGLAFFSRGTVITLGCEILGGGGVVVGMGRVLLLFVMGLLACSPSHNASPIGPVGSISLKEHYGSLGIGGTSLLSQQERGVGGKVRATPRCMTSPHCVSYPWLVACCGGARESLRDAGNAHQRDRRGGRGESRGGKERRGDGEPFSSSTCVD